MRLPGVFQIEAEFARRSLHEYIRQGWSVLEPATPFEDNWHVGAICEHLEAQTNGQIKKLLINIPFRMAKSLMTCVFWPSWEWISHPATQWLFTSYASALSLRDSVKCRTLIESKWYQSRWGHRYQITKNAEHRYENNQKGVRIATSFDGLGTGEGGNRIVIDDAHNMKEILSTTTRNETIRVWKESLSSRRNNPVNDTFTAIMQRGHERDFSGYVLAEEGDWEHLCLPMEYEPKRMVFIRRDDGTLGKVEKDVSEIRTSLGFVDPRRQEGELLHPKRFTAKILPAIKRSLGTYGTSGQLQQRPTPAEGGLFDKKNWKFYRRASLPDSFDEVIQSWDMAFKKTDDSSKVAGHVWARRGAEKYLLHRVTKRMDFVDSLKAVVQMSVDYPMGLRKLIEDKANGPAVINVLKSKIPGLTPREPNGSKEARAQVASIHQEAGNIWLPHPDECQWTNEFIDLLAGVPLGEWDDCDSMSQAMIYFGPVSAGIKIDPENSILLGGGMFSDETAPWNMGG